MTVRFKPEVRIVYLTDRAGVSGGGIFPNGMNGKIRTT